MKKVLCLLALFTLVVTILLASCNQQEQQGSEQSSEQISENSSNHSDEQSTVHGGDTEASPNDSQGSSDTEPPTPSDTTNPGEDNPHVHVFGDWEIITDATCVEDGEQKRVCACGEVETQSINAFGHTEVIDEVVEPTCSDQGLTEGKHCATCDAVFVAQNVISATGVHEYINEVCKYCDAKRPYSEGLIFTSNGDGTCYISGIGTCEDTDVVIPPKSPDGDSVTSIGENAFNCCYNLKNITIPDSVTSIGESAFYGCTSLTSIVIPDSVIRIGEGACSGCSGLLSITIPFVGESVKTAEDMNQYPFGYIFGKQFYEGGTGIWSTYITDITDSSLSIASGYYYIPNGLTSVTVTGGNILYGAFSNCTSLKSITIPNSVTSIGNYAFSDCTSLTSITIPDSVTSIGYSAFTGCTSLMSINIPDSVISIGMEAFSGCPCLGNTVYEGIYYFGNECNPYHALIGPVDRTQLSYKIHENTKLICDRAFYDCTSLREITIPNSVTNIGDQAFTYCDSLTRISIPFVGKSKDDTGDTGFRDIFGTSSYDNVPASLTTVIITGGNSISDFAFHGCNSLTSVTISDSVTSIGNYAFYGCTGLTSIVIPNSVISIGYNAFYHCTSLMSVTIGKSVTSIGKAAFEDCTELKNITIPNSVTSIGENAFDGCISLEYNVYEGVNYLGNSDYPYLILINPVDPKLNSYTLHENTRIIYEDAFRGCTGLTSIILPDSITSIGASAFYKCTGLTSIIIPEGVTNLGESVFSSCTNLMSITIPDSVTSVGVTAFYKCTSLEYNVYEGVNYLGNSNNPYLILINPVDPKLNSYELHENTKIIYYAAFRYCTNLTNIAVPNSVTSIGDSVFSGCSDLTSITLPDGVASIGNQAFYSCTSLTSLAIPDSVTSIGNYAFYDCTGLTSIIIPDSVTSIGEYAFYCCTGLASITIPDSVTKIGIGAFQNCTDLMIVFVPDSVISIGQFAFDDCTSLTDIYYSGSSSQWADISANAYVPENTIIHYNYVP
ncbi:MAG: leucine-rich repeat domain-containing protein [Clostridia bacterium]|nr:leucine-rich repeat domain-containing protein [Clostridia bacterium]